MEMTNLEYLVATVNGHVGNDCLIWNRGKHTSGYGSLRRNSKDESAHRIAYELFVGPIPVGMFVCHTCDVRACFSPRHLFVGSQTDNMRDASRKARLSHGSNHPNSKIAQADIELIKASTLSDSAISLKFQVHRKTVYQIRHGQTWREPHGVTHV